MLKRQSVSLVSVLAQTVLSYDRQRCKEVKSHPICFRQHLLLHNPISIAVLHSPDEPNTKTGMHTSDGRIVYTKISKDR